MISRKLASFVVVVCLLPLQSFARVHDDDKELRENTDWKGFDLAMQEAEIRERHEGWAYIASGTLITIGSFIGSERTDDTGSKFILGVAESLGVAGVGYGVAKISFGNDYNSFYEALRHTSLTESQRNELVKRYLEEEREKREVVRRTQMIAHLVVGAMNLYSASREQDETSKNFFGLLAGVNFALALSYTF